MVPALLEGDWRSHTLSRVVWIYLVALGTGVGVGVAVGMGLPLR